MCGIDFTSQWWNVSSWRHRSLDSHKGRLCRLSLYSVTMDGWMDRLWGNSGLSLTLVSFISMTMLCFLSSSGSWNLSVTCFTVYFFPFCPLIWLSRLTTHSPMKIPWPLCFKDSPYPSRFFQKYEAWLKIIVLFLNKRPHSESPASWDPLCRFGQAKTPGNPQVSVSLKTELTGISQYPSFPWSLLLFTYYYTNSVWELYAPVSVGSP